MTQSDSIRADIERTVAHIARVNGTDQMTVWNEMYVMAQRVLI